jgi:carbamoyl-phosphate synthase large subunit
VPWVLDVNPRFGGGYPFSHVAGADAPTFLLSSALGRAPDPSLLDYEVGVVAERFEEVRRAEVRAVARAREDAGTAPAA